MYKHQIPRPQYSNLTQQPKTLPLPNPFNQLKEIYTPLNFLFPHILKLTPSSKLLPHIAFYILQNHLNQHTIIKHPYKFHFPQSLLSFF
ncbi:hypothetical protein, partial [Staphylococcus saprophyticus]|uniref:hypothetical protein n=1 Tax=Staphylococcus saprophyticus TaxID=29385 RepID=UPI003703D239